MPSRISLIFINSLAVCERDDSPGPNFRQETPEISAWFDRVGEPNGVRPNSTMRLTNGCSGAMDEEFKRSERGVASDFTFAEIMSAISLLL